MTRFEEKTIALAGIFQASALVQQIAATGTVNESTLTTSIHSILKIDSPDTLTVFGSLQDLRTGLKTMLEQLGDQPGQRDVNIARYVISLFVLARKLLKHHAMIQTIRERLTRVQQQVEIFGITHDNVLANLAGIYTDTISQLQPRIMVSGEQGYLTNRTNADRIRSVLLAGIRAAVLWEQLGGSRWQILFKRRLFVQTAKNLYESAS